MSQRKKKFILVWSTVIGCFFGSLSVSISSGKIWAAPWHDDSIKIEESSPFEKGGWVYNTSHYTAAYNTSKTAAQRMTEQLENLRNVFFSAFEQDFDLQIPEQRMKVYLFNTETEFRQYLNRRTPYTLASFGLYDIHTRILLLLDPQGSPRYQRAVKDLEVLEHRIEETQRRIDFHEQRLTGKVPGSTARGQQWLSDQKRKQNEAQERLSRELKQLPMRLRIPLLLHDLEGLAYNEISTICSIREGTVKSRIFRGRRLLKERLRDYFDGGVP